MTNSHDTPFDQRKNHDAGPGSPLDEDRLASMADEGSVSAALMEIEDARERKHLIAKQRKPDRFPSWRAAATAVALAGLGVFIVGWLRRNA